MINAVLVGAGKMGISHLSILGAHPSVNVVGICDTSKLTIGALQKYSSFPCFSDYLEMADRTRPDAAIIAVPTKHHYSMVRQYLQRNIHVFVEKPFCLNENEGKELAELAKSRNLVNQVGYHNKFIGTFREMKRLIKDGFLGKIYHFTGEAYGPVVVRKKQETWRSSPMEGGGCLMDYASHVIDLINDIIAPIEGAIGSMVKSVYSSQVDDAVYSLLELSNQVTGVLSVNWSDETYRKMSTSLTVIGAKGKIICDATELKAYFKSDDCPPGYTRGWNIKHITDFAEQVDFYLRGEEYSAQIDYFIKSVMGEAPNKINTFESAWLTDRAISIIKNNSKKAYNGKNLIWG